MRLMKKLIILKVGDPNPTDKKISKNDQRALEDFAKLLSIKEFKKQASVLDFKIVKEYPDEPSMVIEFTDSRNQEIYDSLRVLSIVETIDSIIPED